MTDQHPLTDEIIDTLASPQYDCFEDVGDVNCGFTYDDMRAATDWQLEQVTKWLKSNTADYVGLGCYFLTESFLDDFKKAMRPITTQEDN